MMTNRDWSNPVQCLTAARIDVDGVPVVRLTSAYRDIGCKGSGDEEFRRVVYAPRAGDVAPEWPDADRLPPPGDLASARRARVMCEVPVGTLVQRFARTVFRGARGRCSVSFGLVVQHPDDPVWGKLIELKHRTLRSRPVYEISLPTGELCFVARRKDA